MEDKYSSRIQKAITLGNGANSEKISNKVRVKEAIYLQNPLLYWFSLFLMSYSSTFTPEAW